MAQIKWQSRRLDELGFVGRGKSRHRPRNDARLYGGPYPFIQTADIMAADPYIITYSQTYSEFGLQQSKMWPPNTLCMTIAGANTAKTAILRFKACFPDSIVGFIPDSEKSDLHFVKYSLDLMRNRFLSVSRGATQDNLSLDKLLSFPILAPEAEEQRRIAGILSAYDGLIEVNKRRIKILEAMARAIYREWFVNENLPSQLKVQGIRRGQFSELCALIKEPFSERIHAGLPLLDLARMPQQSLAPGETGNANELATARILFKPGDTLFGAIRCYLHKVTVVHFPGVTNSSVLVLRPKQPFYRSLVALLASDIETIRWADTHSTGTKMPVINWGVLQTMPALLPSDELANHFENIAGPFMDQIGALSTQIQNLRRTRDLLLPRLLSGQIDIIAS